MDFLLFLLRNNINSKSCSNYCHGQWCIGWCGFDGFGDGKVFWLFALA